MNPQWARDIRDDCQRYGIAFLHKQWGAYKSNPLVIEGKLFPRQAKTLDPHGKGGAFLDGRLWREFPAPRQPCHSEEAA
jgi:protein gp37